MNDLSPTSVPLPPLPLEHGLSMAMARAFDALARGVDADASAADMWFEALEAPSAQDAPLAQAIARLNLDGAEGFALGVLASVERDAALAQRVAACQTGAHPARPSLDTLTRAGRVLGFDTDVRALLEGALARQGMLRCLSDNAPWSVSPVCLTDAMLWAFGLPGGTPLQDLPMAQTALPDAYGLPPELKDTETRLCVVLRGGTRADQILWAQAVAGQRDRRMVLLDAIGDPSAPKACLGLGAALNATGAVPIESLRAAPGTRQTLDPLDGYTGLRIVLAGSEGGVALEGWPIADLRLQAEPAAKNCNVPRVGAGRKAAIAARLALDSTLDMRAAAGLEARTDIEPHGRLIEDRVTTDDMVLPPDVTAELALLCTRCRLRDAHGVRAVLAGPSGSGKTMACTWLATQLDLPLFKVDLSSVVSKYIGETEENLARVLDQAEAADVILLFDEADSLFGARTEARDSSDRYANSQTNYLLSRIEAHSGVVLLTTNGLQRMDGAFARRIDQMVEVPLPDANQRRALWQMYLGRAHDIDPAHLQRIARIADLAGGHIRTISRTARLLAHQRGTSIQAEDLKQALTLAYRGMGRTAPDTGL